MKTQRNTNIGRTADQNLKSIPALLRSDGRISSKDHWKNKKSYGKLKSVTS